MFERRDAVSRGKLECAHQVQIAGDRKFVLSGSLIGNCLRPAHRFQRGDISPHFPAGLRNTLKDRDQVGVLTPFEILSRLQISFQIRKASLRRFFAAVDRALRRGLLLGI